MYKFLLQSGKKVQMNIAPLQQGDFLLRTILPIAGQHGFNLADLFTMPMFEILEKHSSTLLNIFASSDVLEAVEDCCSKVSYDGKPYKRDLFENEENRQDFYPLLLLVGLENLRPFFPAVHSGLEAIEALILMNADTQK